mmetsp:Transcript_44236/g.32228  ORF Transcript_44236/g.32228 Transcript_44236/m.32228 type:complete len:83 (-) Transcript_44236:1413-1661(-)
MHDGTLVFARTLTQSTYPAASWFAYDSKDPFIKLEAFDWAGYHIIHSGSRAQLAVSDGSGSWETASNINVSPDTMEPEPDNT